jgi:periplasmic copper chaperone A
MRSTLLALSASLMIGFSSVAAIAQTSDIEIKDPWARATPGGAQTGAVYVTVTSPTGDRLTAVSTPAAKEAQLHSMSMNNGVMQMRQVDGVDLPAGKPVTLGPGGYHIMLMGLAKPLVEGQSFPMTLTFAKAGTKEVTVPIEKVGAMGPGGASGSSGNTNMPGMNMPMQHH